jgi:hypothetical protein
MSKLKLGQNALAPTERLSAPTEPRPHRALPYFFHRMVRLALLVPLAGAAPAWACQEFTNAITWSGQGTSSSPGSQYYPVAAYFTKHFGSTSTPPSTTRDSVHYATGSVTKTASNKLSGTLVAVSTNQFASTGTWAASSSASYYIEITVAPGATTAQISYQQRINNQPVGGMPPTVVQATCVGGTLLSAPTGNAVVTIGVARQPSYIVPPA